MRGLSALIHVSFQNTIRQPFFLLITVASYIFILSSPAFTMFTLMNSARMILDVSMATILLVLLSVSVLTTSSIVAGEVEEKTTILILSKPVSRLTFLIGKFCAVALSLLFVLIPLISVLIMTLHMGVPEAAYSEVRYPTLWFEFSPLIGALIIGAGANYYADKHFASTFMISLNILVVISLTILYFLNKGALQINLLYPAIFLWMAGIIISPIASVLSLRGNILFTLVFSFIIFILGLTSNYLLGDILNGRLMHFVYSLIPNFQIFWRQEIWAKGKTIPFSYFVTVAKYVIIYCSAVILLGWSFWERKEIS